MGSACFHIGREHEVETAPPPIFLFNNTCPLKIWEVFTTQNGLARKLFPSKSCLWMRAPLPFCMLLKDDKNKACLFFLKRRMRVKNLQNLPASLSPLTFSLNRKSWYKSTEDRGDVLLFAILQKGQENHLSNVTG